MIDTRKQCIRSNLDHLYDLFFVYYHQSYYFYQNYLINLKHYHTPSFNFDDFIVAIISVLFGFSFKLKDEFYLG